MLTILFDGIAYGMLLFVLAAGLAVTLGLMNFVNLAHGAFAMAGGYATVVLMNRFGVPFLACLPLAFLFSATLGFIAERTLYRHMYERSHLDQVLFSIGLVFMAIAATDYLMGSQQQNIRLPAWLQGRIAMGDVTIGLYRLFIVVVCGLMALGLQWVLAKTRFGSQLRAAVDDRRQAPTHGDQQARKQVPAQAADPWSTSGTALCCGKGHCTWPMGEESAQPRPSECRGRSVCQ